MTMGKRISAARKKEGLTQVQLAELCGVATITIQQYERDKRQPRRGMLEKISTILKADPFQLLFGETQEAWNARLEEEVEDHRKEMEDTYLPGCTKVLVNAFNLLNEEGQQKAIERVEELTEIPKYKKEPPQE